MRSMLSATLMVVTNIFVVLFVVLGASAQAQLTPPTTGGAKPKVVTTVPIRPALQKPEETANAMAQMERLALQSDLAWVDQLNGSLTGDATEPMFAALKQLHKHPTGQ